MGFWISLLLDHSWLHSCEYASNGCSGGQLCGRVSVRARSHDRERECQKDINATEKLEKMQFLLLSLCSLLGSEQWACQSLSECDARQNRCWRFCKTDCTPNARHDFSFFFSFRLMDPSRWPLQLSAQMRQNDPHAVERECTIQTKKRNMLNNVDVSLVIYIMRASARAPLVAYNVLRLFSFVSSVVSR